MVHRVDVPERIIIALGEGSSGDGCFSMNLQSVLTNHNPEVVGIDQHGGPAGFHIGTSSGVVTIAVLNDGNIVFWTATTTTISWFISH